MTATEYCIVGMVSVLVLAPVLSSCTGISPNEEQLQRARTACVQAGLPSDSSQVGDCVARMQAALMSNGQ